MSIMRAELQILGTRSRLFLKPTVHISPLRGHSLRLRPLSEKQSYSGSAVLHPSPRIHQGSARDFEMGLAVAAICHGCAYLPLYFLQRYACFYISLQIERVQGLEY